MPGPVAQCRQTRWTSRGDTNCGRHRCVLALLWPCLASLHESRRSLSPALNGRPPGCTVLFALVSIPLPMQPMPPLLTLTTQWGYRWCFLSAFLGVACAAKKRGHDGRMSQEEKKEATLKRLVLEGKSTCKKHMNS